MGGVDFPIVLDKSEHTINCLFNIGVKIMKAQKEKSVFVLFLIAVFSGVCVGGVPYVLYVIGDGTLTQIMHSMKEISSKAHYNWEGTWKLFYPWPLVVAVAIAVVILLREALKSSKETEDIILKEIKRTEPPQ